MRHTQSTPALQRSDESIDTLLADHQLYHSDFQLDQFITARSGGTPYGCYKQALRELDGRRRSIRDLRLSLERLKLDIEEIKRRGRRWFRGSIAKRRDAIDVQEKRAAVAELTRALADAEREQQRFYEQAVRLKEIVGELTPERRAVLDREFWEHRIRCMAATDILVFGGPQKSTVEMILAIPQDMRRAITATLSTPEGRGRLVAWLESGEPSFEPQPCLCTADT